MTMKIGKIKGSLLEIHYYPENDDVEIECACGCNNFMLVKKEHLENMIKIWEGWKNEED